MDFLGGGGREQPLRQGFFTGADSCGRDELEERPAPEEIQVGGVRVIRLEEPFPCFTRARPSPLESREPLAVVLDGP